MRSCVDVLDRYLAELRRYMAKFPRPAGGDTSGLERVQEEDAHEDEWEQLQTEVAALFTWLPFPRRSLLTRCFMTRCVLHNRK